MTGKAADGTKSPLRQRMIDQMRIANLAESTRYAYILEIEHLAKHYKASPADLDAEQVRDWVLTLIDKGLSPSSTNATLSALRFLYVDTLGCPDRLAGLRNRKKPHTLPRHMTEQEVERLILATPGVLLATLIVIGMRIAGSDYIVGDYHGPNHEEAWGVFDTGDYFGKFGARWER